MSASFKFGSILLSLCEIIVGILLLINPVGFTTGIIIFLGLVILILGIANIVQYFRAIPEEAALKQSLTRGCIEILAGLFCIFKSGWFIATFPILTILYGIGILITGIAKVQWTVDKIRLKIKKWYWSAISAVLTIAFAAVILCNPFSSTTVLWGFIGVILIVEAVVDIVAVIFTRRVL
ncbi:MAG: HdeD family acid-resistance protein [Acutalibacteraceae bacterium]